MSQITDKVMPGDLVTAKLFNRVIDEINVLQTKVAALESIGPVSGKVIIADIQPQNPAPRVNQELRIFGQNFNFTGGATQVILDGNVAVNTFISGTGDQLLIFKIPFIPNLPAQGRPVLVEVSNLTSTDSRTITILPVLLVLEGGVDVTWQSTDPLTITPGNPVTFKYLLKSRASLNANFTITPEITVAANQQDWQNQIKVLDSQQSEIADMRIPLNVNEEKAFFVRISSVPPNTNNVKFKLKVTASAGTVGNSDGPKEFTVGQAVQQPDINIGLGIPTPPASPGVFPNGATLDRTTSPPTIRIPTPTGANQNSVRLSVIATIKAVGEYTASGTVTSGTGWSTSVNTQLLPNPFPINQTDFSNSSEVTRELRFLISVPVGASPTGDLELRLQRTGSATNRTLPLKLALI